MPKLKFADLKNKSSFTTDVYELMVKNTKRGRRYFAVAVAPSGSKSYRIVSKDFFMSNK